MSIRGLREDKSANSPSIDYRRGKQTPIEQQRAIWARVEYEQKCEEEVERALNRYESEEQ